MLDGTRRGYLAGYEMGKIFPSSRASDETLQALARCVYTLCAEEGYAHIDPQEEFVSNFVQGFRSVSKVKTTL